MSQFSETATEASSNELDALEAGIEQAAGEAGLSEQEVQQLEAALEAAAGGDVSQQELEAAASTLEAMSNGEMSVGELAYQEQFLGFLAPVAKAAVGLLSGSGGSSIVSGIG